MVRALGILESGLRKCLDGFLYKTQELIGDGAVDDTMIERDRKISTSADRDCVLSIGAGQHLWPLLDRSDAEDRDLRLIDDRRSHQRPEHPWIRDGERSFLHFLGRELLGAGTGGKIIERSRDSREREIVGVLDHG